MHQCLLSQTFKEICYFTEYTRHQRSSTSRPRLFHYHWTGGAKSRSNTQGLELLLFYYDQVFEQTCKTLIQHRQWNTVDQLLHYFFKSWLLICIFLHEQPFLVVCLFFIVLQNLCVIYAFFVCGCDAAASKSFIVHVSHCSCAYDNKFDLT